jgi:hypothetical protein
MCIDITIYSLVFLYSFTYTCITYTTILITIPCNIIFIMGVQLRNPFALDLDFGITNSDSREVQISQIDFGSEPP